MELKELMIQTAEMFPKGTIDSNIELYKGADKFYDHMIKFGEAALLDLIDEDFSVCFYKHEDIENIRRKIFDVLFFFSLGFDNDELLEKKEIICKNFFGVEHISDNPFISFMAYILDNNDLIECNTFSIDYSWTTEKGKLYMEVLELYFRLEEKEGK